MVEFHKEDIGFYKEYSKKYLPKEMKVLFIAESPPFPKKGIKSYFYFDEYLPKKDLLFQLIVKSIYDFDFKLENSKINFLNKLRDDGYYLIDIVDYPIDLDKDGNPVEDNVKNTIFENKKNSFLEKLKELKVTNDSKIILIKENIFKYFNKFLLEKNFNVLNEDKINFPFWYDYDFINEIRYLLNFNNVDLRYCFRKLLNYFTIEIKYKDINKAEDIRAFILFELSRILVDYGEAILLLIKNRKSLCANIIGRSILEAWFTIKWILEDSSKINALKFYVKNFESRKDKAKYLELTIEDTERLEKDEKKFIEKAVKEFKINVNYENDFVELKKYPSYKEIAESVKLVDYYNTIYKYFCDFSHIGSITTGKYFKEGYEFHDEENYSYNDLVILLSGIYFYFLDNIEKYFKIEEKEKVEKINNYFINFAKDKQK